MTALVISVDLDFSHRSFSYISTETSVMQKNRKISVRWLAVTFPACKKNLEGSYSILGISQLDVRRRQSFLSANLLIISIFRSKKDISLLVTPSLLPLFILPAPTLIVQWGKKSLQ